MNILKPLRPSGLLSEEEALKDIESAPDAEIPRDDNKQEVQEMGNKHLRLGVDYGLIYIDRATSDLVITDGKDFEVILREVNLNDVFYDEKLYYTKDCSLYEWPSRLLHDYGVNGTGGKEAVGIGKHDGRLIVTLPYVGEIADEQGNIIFEGLQQPISVCSYKGELYHTEASQGRGLVKTPYQLVHRPGRYALGLAAGEKIFFGGEDETLYSYDGQVQRVCNLGSTCGLLECVGDVLYAAGLHKIGIHSIPLDDPSARKTLLRGHVPEGIRAMTAVPMTFIHELSENK